MNNLVKDDSTVLVINGVPYSLVTQKHVKVYDVCSLCELKELCCPDAATLRFVDLCEPLPGMTSWFFVTDWDIVDNKIRNYLDIDHVEG